jgi:hypothetical protein
MEHFCVFQTLMLSLEPYRHGEILLIGLFIVSCLLDIFIIFVIKPGSEPGIRIQIHLKAKTHIRI